MAVIFEQEPIQFSLFVPFNKMSEFLTHEEKFLSGETDHISKKRTESGKLLVIFAGHFSDERTFSVDHFIVRERKDEVFGESIHHSESELVVVVLAVKSVLKAPLDALLAGHMAARGLRYFFVVLTAGILWPMTFKWFQKLSEV